MYFIFAKSNVSTVYILCVMLILIVGPINIPTTLAITQIKNLTNAVVATLETKVRYL